MSRLRSLGSVARGSIALGSIALGSTLAALPSRAQDTELPAWSGSTDATPPECFAPPAPPPIDGRPPSAEAVRGLVELESEAERTSHAARRFGDELASLLEHDHRRGVRRLEVEYGRRIDGELTLADDARDRAITLFERFVARHPDDGEHTADAMFRLGQLYYDRATTELAESDDTHPALEPVVTLYRDLLARFPDFRARAGVLYLLGYCLAETGELEEAVTAWRSLVCSGDFTYPTTAVASSPAELAAEREHPSLTLDAPAGELATTGADPYATCVPLPGADALAAETWLRIGEHHFDFDGEPGFLDRAISAYRRVIATGEGRTVDLALYKIAWSYYRAARYPEAIEHFAELVARADASPDGAASSLRPEAIRYLALTFAYDDWDEDGRPDTRDRPEASGLARALDPALFPVDAAFHREVLAALGEVYFEEARFALAIGTWDEVLARWPLAAEAPSVALRIADAEGRAGNPTAADRREDELAERFGAGSAWAVVNPDESLAVGERLRDLFLARGVRHHRHASELRAAGRDDEATSEYGVAVDSYSRFLAAHPDAPEAYDVAYNRAEALFWSGRYEEAAVAYTSVRDSRVDDRYLADAARRVVVSYEQIVAAGGEATAPRARLPEADASHAVPRLSVPEAVANVARARETYLARVSAARDVDRLRGAYALNQALLLESYGYFDDARDRYWAIYRERCNTGREAADAWAGIVRMAGVLDDANELQRLEADVDARACTFTGSAAPAPGERPGIDVDGIRGDIRFRVAVRTYESADARAAAGDDAGARGLYEQAATLLLDAVEASPDHPDAPRALLLAGQALARSDHHDAAARVYRRVVEEVGPIVTSDRERQATLDELLAIAYLALADASRGALDYEEALASYGAVADSSRFRRSDHPAIPAMIEEAVVNGANLSEALQRWEEAAGYYRRAAALLEGDEARVAAFRAAEMAHRRGDWAAVVVEMGTFLDVYGRDRAGVNEAVTAAWRIAEARDALGSSERARRAALEAVVDRYVTLGGTSGSDAAELAGHAAFLLAQPALEPIEHFRIAPGTRPTLDAYTDALAGEISEGARRARAASDALAPVLSYGRPTWSVAAVARQGRAWERLAVATLEAPFEMPADLERRFHRLPADEREALRVEIEDRVRQSLEPWTRSFECIAVSRYVIAARAARVASLDDESVREALDRLGRYGNERITECVELVRTGDPAHGITADPTLDPYTPGELARAARGATEEPAIAETSLGVGLTGPDLAD